MDEIALFARADGLFEPRTDEGVEFAKENSGAMFLVRSKGSNRSNLQNRYLWGWVYSKQIVPMLKEAGIMGPANIPWTKDTLHILFREKFLVEGEIEIEGQMVKVYESTSKMSSKRFWQHVEEIKEFSYEAWGIVIDEPRDRQKDSWYIDVLREIR